jgi:hypothetical protein
MAKRDFAQQAHGVFLQSIGEQDKAEPAQAPDKDPAAMSLGSKGGKARASKLTPEQRSAIAKKAAAARWPKK